jgi:hypothetical protein
MRAGYTVENCHSALQLEAVFDSSCPAEAVLMTDHEGKLPQDAITLTRSRSVAPLILFRDSNHSYAESAFDLVVPSLTAPGQWLEQIALLLEESRVLRAKSALLRAESRMLQHEAILLQRDAAELREKTRLERARSAHERAPLSEPLCGGISSPPILKKNLLIFRYLRRCPQGGHGGSPRCHTGSHHWSLADLSV